MSRTPHVSFLADETGAVTVDWVVLTAALVGLGLAVMTVVSSGVEDLSSDINGVLQDDSIIQTAFASGYSAFTPATYDAILEFALNGDSSNPVPDETYVRDTFEMNVSDAEAAIARGDQAFAEYYMDGAAAWAEGARQRDIEIIGSDDAMTSLREGYARADFPAS